MPGASYGGITSPLGLPSSVATSGSAASAKSTNTAPTSPVTQRGRRIELPPLQLASSASASASSANTPLSGASAASSSVMHRASSLGNMCVLLLTFPVAALILWCCWWVCAQTCGNCRRWYSCLRCFHCSLVGNKRETRVVEFAAQQPSVSAQQHSCIWNVIVVPL
jgi:hypothetical protein